MKKKVLTVLLMGCMVFSLAACSKKEEPKNNETEQTEEKDSEEDSEYSAMGTSTLTELGEYKGISYKLMNTEVTEEELEAKVQEIVENSTMKNPQETATEKTVVNIDYVGKKDGVEFEGGKAEGTDLDLGNSNFIPGFAESIVGMKVGETKDCPMTFPEDYHVEDLKGAEVVFTITVNECWENVPAELNDEFAQSQDCENVEDFYAKVRESYETAKKDEAEYDKQLQILGAIIDNSKFDINDEEVALYADQIRTQQENMAYMYYGVDLETYVTGMGMTMEQFEQDCTDTGLFRLQTGLIKEAIAEKENLTISDEEYAGGVEHYMNNYGYTDQEQFESAMGKESIMEQLLFDKVLQFIEESAVVTE